MNEERPYTFLCLANEFKGIPFLIEAKRLGCYVIVLTDEKRGDAAWPHDSIDEFYKMPDISEQPAVTYAVSYLARGRKIDRIVALDDYDVATAASLREHLRLPGLGESGARFFRDKLGMRVRAQSQGIVQPAFTAVFNYDDLRTYMETVAAPWVLKPRFEAGAIGIQKLSDAVAVWRALENLGDKQSYYLLEQFLPGDVYHVDTLIWQGEPLFALVSKYGAPPLSLTQGGGIFNTRILSRESDEAQRVLAANKQVLNALQHPGGAAHTEFIRAHADGRFYFLETAARVGGANIDKMVKAATGIELWAEAARIEVAKLRGENYELPPHRDEYAALITCLARQEHPDLSTYTDPEIVWRLDKPYHAGFLLASPDAGRIEELLGVYNGRFAQEFLHHQQNTKKARTTF